MIHWYMDLTSQIVKSSTLSTENIKLLTTYEYIGNNQQLK